MKAILEFNLPEDNETWEVARKWQEMSWLIGEWQRELRNDWHWNRQDDKTGAEVVTLLYKRWRAICEEYGVDPDL